MQRIFLQENISWKQEIILDDIFIFHQIIKVLRSQVWDKFVFFNNWIFTDYVYEITSIWKKNIIFKFIWEIEKNIENKILNLYQSLPNKIDKIELILQKWVEVWYSNFYFFRSERSQDLKNLWSKNDRFEKIVIEASEQSWRNIIPKIYFLGNIDFSNLKWNSFYFHTNLENSKTLKDIIIDDVENNIFVWPEWGFSESETLEFDKNNFSKIHLWNNILRTETASIVVWFWFNQK